MRVDLKVHERSNVTIVYTKPGCVQCGAVYRRMNKKGIEFDVRDVSVDESALARVRSLGYSSVPVVETDSGEHWNGYIPAKIDALAA